MADKKHSFTRTEIKAGLMVIAAAAVLAVFVAAVAGLRPPKPVKVFYADFVNVKGLHKGNEVMFGGRGVGRVRNVEFLDGQHSKLRVEFDVLEAAPVNAECVAKITQTTLTSENHLEVTTGKDDAPLLTQGATLKSQEGDIFDLAGQVGDDLSELLGDVRELLGAKDRPDEERVTVATLLTNLDTALSESTGAIQDVRGIVRDNRKDAEDIIQKLQDVEDSAYAFVGDLRGIVAENRDTVGKTVESVQQAAERIARTTERLDSIADSLKTALENIKDMSGDASGFVEKSRPVLEEILLDVRETVWHLKEFARTIEEQPEAVLRGAAPQGRKP